MADHASQLSRRSFLAASVGLGSFLAALRPESAPAAEGPAPMAEPCILENLPVLPPGATGQEWFFAHCTGCQLCVAACPQKVIGATGQPPRLLQPVMDYDQGCCLPDCVICTRVCPADALRPLQPRQKRRLQTGIAELEASLCLAGDGECVICARSCPATAIMLVEQNGARLPKVDPDLCTGCGACQYHCPVQPAAIRVHGNREQIRL